MEKQLSKAQTGDDVVFKKVDAGHALRQRLAALGLIPKTIIHVIKNENRGQVIIKIKNSRIVLGRGMSEKIIVTEK